ncbi:MAG: M81 family metallopeptidase [Chloroflexi bacterium]|nr:M81 family metallopeptidase [Chloroflexota bacterium]
MRLAALGLAHETNTFSRVLADLEMWEVLRGDELRQKHATATTTLAGYFSASQKLGFEIVPLIFATTGPIGIITRRAFDILVDEMLQLLRDNGPWDGVLLAQHGAAVSDEFPDADGEIVRRVREVVGPDVPIGVNFDMHANVTQKVIDHSTVTVVYATNPHLDAKERAEECAELIVRTIKGEITPVQVLEMPPLVVNIIKQYTGEEPMKGIVETMPEMMRRPGILSVSIAEGYPYADVEEMGMSFLAISDGDREVAQSAARAMADVAWERKEALQGDIPSIAEALQYADAQPEGPIVLMDVGDNIGAGSSADSTFLLAEAKRLGIRGYLQTLYDPEAVGDCVEVGVGSKITMTVGGKTDDMHGEPVMVTGTVRAISDGLFEDPLPTHGGWRFFDGGTSAVLETTDGHTILLTSKRVGNTSLEQMYSVGIDPARYRVVIAKGVVSPRPAYSRVAKEIVLADTPGVTTTNLGFFAYRNRRTPLYPFELETPYP